MSEKIHRTEEGCTRVWTASEDTMGRPRKDSNTPEAKDQLISTFWNMLETRDMSDITVGSLVSEAGVNRGTFYYHYENMDDFIGAALERDIRGKGGNVETVFNMLTNANSLGDQDRIENFRHIGMMMRKGGFHIANNKIKSIINDIWGEVICNNERPLKDETVIFFEFTISGIMGVMNHIGEQYEITGTLPDLKPNAYINSIPQVLIKEIAAIEGLSTDELIEKIEIYRKNHPVK